ncbi:unnamed protein product [Protopolystoma xenopodis]|uniref:Uncharacterized protein n=1 Tax=Protopolystoma xenopodis TaxID=117903 RepID=A0A448XGV4_9PLAT|nr:unnamed protein product [Protopolystoma xenopodis]
MGWDGMGLTTSSWSVVLFSAPFGAIGNTNAASIAITKALVDPRSVTITCSPSGHHSTSFISSVSYPNTPPGKQLLPLLALLLLWLPFTCSFSHSFFIRNGHTYDVSRALLLSHLFSVRHLHPSLSREGAEPGVWRKAGLCCFVITIANTMSNWVSCLNNAEEAQFL